MTTGQETYNELMRLKEMADALVADHCIGDHAYWLHVDHTVLKGCADKLEAMGAAIEDERCSGR